MARIDHLAGDLILIDTDYSHTPEAIGVYLLLGERPALIETGPASTIETLLDGIRAAGLDPRDLQAIAVTHIHLDHAGAAGTLVNRFPHLDVYVHPVGAPHLIDPARLLASARRLYGDALERLMGETIPLPRERVHMLEDGAQVRLGSRQFVALDTPGHASHHLAFLDEASGDLFTGDAAGVALPGSRYVAPPTPPPDLDIPAWRATLARLRALHPRRLLLTHFGPHTWVDDLLTQLEGHLDARERLAMDAVADGLDEETFAEELRVLTAREIAEVEDAGQPARYDVMMPARNNVLGLIRYATRRARRVEHPQR
jgi:glyoxylase-like metal-dependent hydrolase (beta-lactamase superfamily II)